MSDNRHCDRGKSMNDKQEKIKGKRNTGKSPSIKTKKRFYKSLMICLYMRDVLIPDSTRVTVMIDSLHV